MSAYRCYCLNQNGRIADVEIIECSDDREVPGLVDEMLIRRGQFAAIEAWRLDRMVVRRPRKELGAFSVV
ncbi:MAG TPA: hypothetical protein VM689_19095 [Aliidongia sp.]|nr:hypothetical protein [Aliidongia sp.]